LKGNLMNEEIENVVCTCCGKTKVVVKGHLTEQGKREFRCYPCTVNETVEGRAEARREEGQDLQRRLLLEG